jgi:UDP-3-O-[3-hydroxymyristoyl] N-acetylglucosamine deacetylase
MGTKFGVANGFLRQRTLKNSIHCSGIGLHSGIKVNMTLHPAEAGTGIRFRRNGTVRRTEVAATWHNAIETPLNTTLKGDADIKIGTVEHLLSALSGCAIDNVVIELNGPEVPVMDGSSAPFVFLIECAGTVTQDAPRRALEIRRDVTVSDNRRSATAMPGRGLSIDFEIDFDSPVVARQQWSFQVTQASYKREVSRARTFGFLEEVDKLRAMGLALGGSLDNAIVISGDRVLNDGGLRYDNEFVRHKVLDLIGDLTLIGGPVIGKFRCARAGHGMTLRLLQTLFADEQAWRWRELTEADLEVEPEMGPETAMGASVPPARAVAVRA